MCELKYDKKFDPKAADFKKMRVKVRRHRPPAPLRLFHPPGFPSVGPCGLDYSGLGTLER